MNNSIVDEISLTFQKTLAIKKCSLKKNNF